MAKITKRQLWKYFAESLKNLVLIISGVYIALSIEARNYGGTYWFYIIAAIVMYMVFSYIENSYKSQGGENNE